jgi:Na+-transporting methylmalonyl-CoA/oxaloacetate decarboxylase gamma subunit
MSYQEKRIVASLVTGIFVMVTYCLYGIARYQALGNSLLNNLKFWATAMLIVMGLGIVVMILIQILLHIVLAVANEVKKEISKKLPCDKKIVSSDESEITYLEDEMDKLIALKSSNYSFGILGFGFVAGLVSLYYQLPPAIMLNAVFLSFMLASLVEGCLQLRFYRKGIYNG